MNVYTKFKAAVYFWRVLPFTTTPFFLSSYQYFLPVYCPDRAAALAVG